MLLSGIIFRKAHDKGQVSVGLLKGIAIFPFPFYPGYIAMNKVGRYIAIVFLLVVFPTCSLFAPRSKPIELPVKSENLNLAWDAPAYAGTFPGTELSSYRIYYRTYGQTSWTLLDPSSTV